MKHNVFGQNVHLSYDRVPELSDLGDIFANEDELSPYSDNLSFKKEISKAMTPMRVDDSNGRYSSVSESNSAFTSPEFLRTSRPGSKRRSGSEIGHSPSLKITRQLKLQQQFQQEESQRLKLLTNDVTSTSNIKNVNQQLQAASFYSRTKLHEPYDEIVNADKWPTTVGGEVKKLYKVGDHHVLMSSKERRRERNRALARKTREKKKEELETLLGMMKALETENSDLRALLSTNKAKQFENLLKEVNTETLVGFNGYNSDSLSSNSKDKINLSPMAQRCLKAIASEDRKHCQSFYMINIRRENNPIVYASPAFADLTGYSIGEVLGKNGDFLHGKETNPHEVEKMSRALYEGNDVEIVLINYRKNQSKFWNQLKVFTLKNSNGNPVLGMGLHREISEKEAALLSKSSAYTSNVSY